MLFEGGGAKMSVLPLVHVCQTFSMWYAVDIMSSYNVCVCCLGGGGKNVCFNSILPLVYVCQTFSMWYAVNITAFYNVLFEGGGMSVLPLYYLMFMYVSLFP